MATIVPIDNKGDFVTLLDLYNQMVTDQQKLEADLDAGNQSAAIKDIEALQSLVTDMDLEGHACHISTGPVTIDTVFMQNDLNEMMSAVSSGQFQTALADDKGIISSLNDLFQRIV